MRLYPHPPVGPLYCSCIWKLSYYLHGSNKDFSTSLLVKVLLRRAQIADTLPGDYKVNPGQDIMISVYNIHHSSQVIRSSNFCGQCLVFIQASTRFIHPTCLMLSRLFLFDPEYTDLMYWFIFEFVANGFCEETFSKKLDSVDAENVTYRVFLVPSFGQFNWFLKSRAVLHAWEALTCVNYYIWCLIELICILFSFMHFQTHIRWTKLTLFFIFYNFMRDACKSLNILVSI